MKSCHLFFLMMVPLLPYFSVAQRSQQEFHSVVNSVYDFYPHTLNSKQIELKSKELDKFWHKVESNRSTLLPFLRTELADLRNNSFFLYDGSQLLLSLSTDPADKLIALKAIPQGDLNDIQHIDYLNTVHRFSRERLNTTAAALRLLDEPKFSAYVVQHALQVDQQLALLFLLLPIPDHLYIDPAIARLQKERSDTSARSLLNLLWYSVTKRGDSTIAVYAQNSNNPKSARDFAKELQSRNNSFSPSLVSGSKSSDLTSLKEERSTLMQRMSDEALYDLNDITTKIRVAYYRQK